MSTKALTLTAVLTALLCILGPMTLPLGPVPLSLTSALLMLSALLLGPGRAACCCGVYLLIGLVGLPVFAGFTGGLTALAGPTGGYLIGYLPMTALCGWGLRRCSRLPGQALTLLAATALLYALGTAWFCLMTGSGLQAALAVCVLPFLPGDALKAAAVLTGGNAIRRRLKKTGLLM